jgi:integrase
MMEKPKANRFEAAWLEVSCAAALLRAAATPIRKRPERALPHFYPLLATFLLTGGREMEVLGLEVDDISFSRKTVTFRPNQWRRLKTRTSHRSIPLWPQLEEVLSDYLCSNVAPRGKLLFPSAGPTPEQPVADVRKAIDAAAVAAGQSAGTIRTKAFRHTYCAARLQTLDRGHPVSLWTVAKELGHGGTTLVERVYGHLGSIRQRSEFVEFR